MNRYRSLALALSTLSLSAAGLAIIIRHDRDDSQYVKLARGFDAYADIHGSGGTLIAPQWVLTAGHVANNTGPYTSFVKIKGKVYSVDSIVIHPNFARPVRERTDLALLHLTKPVTGVKPVQPYRAQDEVGQEITIIGRGESGNGQTGPTFEDGKLRGATNKIDGAMGHYLVFKFDEPASATDLEGISGPGDSGGPALVKKAGQWAIVGVSSSNIGDGQGPGKYGSTEAYARVSSEVGWIEETMKSKPLPNTEWKTVRSPKSWPDNRAREIAEALLKAYNSGDPAKYESFNQKYRDARTLSQRTPAERAKALADLKKRVGTSLALVEYAVKADGDVVALLRNTKGGYFQLALFFYDPAMTRFDGFNITEGMPRGG